MTVLHGRTVSTGVAGSCINGVPVVTDGLHHLIDPATGARAEHKLPVTDVVSTPAMAAQS